MIFISSLRKKSEREEKAWAFIQRLLVACVSMLARHFDRLCHQPLLETDSKAGRRLWLGSRLPGKQRTGRQESSHFINWLTDNT